MAPVFEVEDICGIFCILVSLLIYCSKNEEYCLDIASLECLRHSRKVIVDNILKQQQRRQLVSDAIIALEQ